MNEKDSTRGRWGRWVPWAAVAFLVAVLAAVVMVALVRPTWFDTPVEEDFDYPYEKDLAAIGRVDGLYLSDDNSTSQTVTLPVPRDSEVELAILDLKGSTEVGASSTVYLRVLADGISVLVEELPVGRHDLEEKIVLPPSVTDDGSVRVQVRTSGNVDQRRCNLSENLGAWVHLDPDGTRIRAGLDEPVHTVRDAVTELDQDVTLVLATPESDREWYATALRVATALTQAGHSVDYVVADDELPDVDGSPVLVGPSGALDGLGWEALGDDDASAPAGLAVGSLDGGSVLAVVAPEADVIGTFLTTSAVTTADGETSAPLTETPARLEGDSVTLAALGADTSVQQISDRRSWRASYSLADLPGGSVPVAIELELEIPVTTDDARWLVQVRLGDQLVDSLRLPGAGAQSARVELPPDLEMLRDQITVTLIRDRDIGGCHVRQTSYDVQLLPTSRLLLGGTGAGFTAVPASFSGGYDLLLPTDVLVDPAASLAAVVPTVAEFSGWQQQPRLVFDGAPGGRPFLLVGDPPPALEAPVDLADDRLSAAGFDLESFTDGLVLQTVVVDGDTNLVLTPVGTPDDVVPDYGRESARVVATAGGGFVVDGSGQVVSDPPVRAESK